MKNLINLKIDYAFKLIFGKEGNEPILIAFLNAALRLPQENQITGITLLNPEINKEYKYFNYLRQTKNYHTVFRLYEEKEKFQLTNALEMHFMELPKLTEKWKLHEVSPWENSLVRWLLLLEGAENQEILKTLEEIAMQDPVLNKAMLEWEKSSDDPKVRAEYLSRRKAVLDEMAAVREAELRLKEAIQEGVQKASEAEQKGKAEGRVEGKVEGKAEVAKNLLEMGMDVSKVAKVTGLSEDEVQRIKHN